MDYARGTIWAMRHPAHRSAIAQGFGLMLGALLCLLLVLGSLCLLLYLLLVPLLVR